jgi:AGCS family alanine or glycine:cation symporter
MSFLLFFEWIMNDIISVPSTIFFFCVALFFTLKTRCIQIRAFGHFLSLVRAGLHYKKENKQAINPFHAMFTAMATTIGMGNIVGPSLAIFVGGPGALFWLLFYTFLASSIKFVEVCFAVHTRIRDKDGTIIGGPMQYLKVVHPALGFWYMCVMVVLFTQWSSVQANTLSSIFAHDNCVPLWLIGVILMIIVYAVLSGGIERVGKISSNLVPIMFVMYVSFSLFVLFKDPLALWNALFLIKQSIFQPWAAIGGFAGVSLLTVMQQGIYRGIYITEAGIGTSAIPHAVADTKRPIDQGILALYSMASDALLCMLSGLLVLVTGVWLEGDFRSTFVYEAFRMQSPFWGGIILMCAISLFVVTTIIGNTFNGLQAFSSLFGHRHARWYLIISMIAVFLGTLLPVKAVWGIMDVLLVLAVIPNLVGIIILACRYPQVIDFRSK